ncbi:hypothetical protein C7B82_26520 [Stenomitos frigidus ULC18]|uniref:histidine kinase n=2 Tax=Stenomitos TaxID=1844270 RepID=A0A2T1DW53_9CYAN|nr:hypothetical protein C7B82_26520 [Stenomitos frigidus ULC18]
MRQVLLNLLNNAVKFTPPGGQVTLLVHLEQPEAYKDSDCIQPIPSGACNLCFSVLDTGIGIAAADHAKLFQAFVQIDSSLNRQYSGTGLGRMLVKQIVELHGSSVIVNSEVGKGSFTVRLPYACQAPNVIAAAPKMIPSEAFLLPNDRVLIVEDSTAAAEQIARYLRGCLESRIDRKKLTRLGCK